MIGDGSQSLAGEVVVEEFVAAVVGTFVREKQLGVAVVGEIRCAEEVHDLSDVEDLACGGEGEPLVEKGVVGRPVAVVARQGELGHAPAFVRQVRGVEVDVGFGVGRRLVFRGRLTDRDAVVGVREGFAEALTDAGGIDGKEGGWLPVVGVVEGGEGSSEDSVGRLLYAGPWAGFEVGDTLWVGDGLDADLGVEVEGGRGGRSDFADGFAGANEGPGGDGREEVGDGFEAGLVGAVGVVSAPLLPGLVEEDADAWFA